jgi:16S rRNA (cytosine967-C5)-methyltransferase
MTVNARRATPGRSGRRSRLAGAARDTARSIALESLVRIESEGGYANLVLASALADTALDARDRALVTELVYGTTRMRRACDWLIDRFLLDDLEPRVRSALRMGAYQITYLRIPAHAAVSATVDVVPARARGLANAVLRRVSVNPVDPDAAPEVGGWPDLATRLSYPDWIVERLTDELGEASATAVLTAMNEPATVHERPDGYVQDLASQAVVDVLEVAPGDRVVDVCAAPGGKATALAGRGAHVVAVDRTRNRARLIVGNAERLGSSGRVQVVVADGRALPLRPAGADTVLVDAPCSGIGSLRRRADARWRIGPVDVDRLAALQRDLVVEAADLVRPGGVLVYSVCTLLDAETTAVDSHLAAARPDLVAEPLGEPFQAVGRGGRLLPTSEGSDGMTCFRYRVPGGVPSSDR